MTRMLIFITFFFRHVLYAYLTGIAHSSVEERHGVFFLLFLPASVAGACYEDNIRRSSSELIALACTARKNTTVLMSLGIVRL